MMRITAAAVLLVASGGVGAEVCRWQDSDGVTHFAAKCPLGVEPEARYGGGTTPFAETPASRSFLIESAQALDARQAAERAQKDAKEARRAQQEEDRYVEKLRREARGNSKGLNQSLSDVIADAQHRRAARDELDRIERRRAGLPPKSEVEQRVERLEKQVRRDRRKTILEREAIRREAREVSLEQEAIRREVRHH